MPRLVIKQGPGVGRDHALSGSACVVGRDASATFVLDDNLASRRHFRIVLEDGAYYAEDLGSTNGTLVNGRRAKRTRLADGDVIQAGGSKITFVQKDMLGGGGPGASKGSAQPSTPAPVARRRRRHLR
jgi:pSer/pThr/pTyr-binding forkhead associated (FHA) protein